MCGPRDFVSGPDMTRRQLLNSDRVSSWVDQLSVLYLLLMFVAVVRFQVMSNSDTTWTAARLSWPSLFPDFQARIPNKSLQEMELNSVPLECGLDSATNEWQMWYMTLMNLGYKKMVTSALNSLALSLQSLTEGKQAVLAFKQPPLRPMCCSLKTSGQQPERNWVCQQP